MLFAASFALALFSRIPSAGIPGPTPEVTLRSAIEGLNQRRPTMITDAFAVVSPDAVNTLTKLFESQMKSMQASYAVDSISVVEAGGTATAQVRISIQSKPPLKLSEETVQFVKSADGWKINNQENGKPTDQAFFTGLGQVVRNPSALAIDGGPAAEKTRILSNMRQISTATLMYTADQDGKFSLTTANLQAKLLPYLKTDQVFKGIDGKPLALAFNSNLSGKKNTALSRPAETVLITLGPKEKLVFIDGVTPIAFADGHVKYLTRPQLSTLRWNP